MIGEGHGHPRTKDEWLDLIVDNLVNEKMVERIVENEKLREKIEYYAEHPMAMSYLSFEAWTNDLLNEIQSDAKVSKP